MVLWLYVLVGGYTPLHASITADVPNEEGGGGGGTLNFTFGRFDIIVWWARDILYWSMILGVYQKNCCCLCYWFLLAYGDNNHDHMSILELSVKSEMMFERLNSFFKQTIHSYLCFTYYLRQAAFGLNKRQIDLMLFGLRQISSCASTTCHEVLFSATEKQIIQWIEIIIFTQPTNAIW